MYFDPNFITLKVMGLSYFGEMLFLKVRGVKVEIRKVDCSIEEGRCVQRL